MTAGAGLVLAAQLTPTGWVLAATLALAGLAVGSFTNVVIDRLPVALDEPNEFGELWDTRPWSEVLGGRSRCSSCGEPVRARDNVPVVSYLLLRGRCRSCGERYGAFHVLVELAVPVAWVAIAAGWGVLGDAGGGADGVAAAGPTAWALVPLLALVPGGVAVAVIDARTLIVPTRIVWPTTGLVVATSVLAALVGGSWDWLLVGLVGVAVLAGPLFAIWWIHPRGMGFGDVRLAVLLGWTVGFAVAAAGGGVLVAVLGVLVVMVVAALIGIGQAAMAGLGRGRQVPFGPALVAATLVLLVVARPFAEPFVL